MQDARTTPEAESSPSGDHAAEDGRPASDALQQLWRTLAEILEYASCWVSLETDALRARVRKVVQTLVLGVVCGLVGATLAIVSVVMVMTGLARAASAVLGVGPGAGELIVGSAALVLIGIGLFTIGRLSSRRAMRATVERYAKRRDQQRRRFGHDITTRAAAAAER